MIVSMFKDVGKKLSGHILCDADAALEVVRRKGIGTMRHLDSDLLWVPGEDQEQGAGVQRGAWLAEIFTKY